MEKIKVLLFAANPRGTQPLDLPREFREIDEEVRLGAFRSAIELILVPGTRPVDLLRKLNENQPQVVHFSSHGSPDEIILESGEEEAEVSDSCGPSVRSADERDMKKLRPDEVESLGPGQHRVVSKSGLVNVLRSCDEGNLRLVVLNACDTRALALALTEVVDCVVSMNQTITDRAAIMFAASFYGALAFGRSVQKAFEQGVARLIAEGIAEAETPELLVRAGVDAGQLVLVGSAQRKPPMAALEAPFIVQFPRNPDFVGRDVDLARLHASLSGHGPVGIRPAGLTGMGGIGKTQLAVEYVHRHRTDYPDGIFWIDAASPLAEGFARLATDPRVKWTENDRPRDEQIRDAFAELNRRPGVLLVLDNLRDPATLAAGVLTGCTPEDLGCHLLFTTRRHDLGRFPGVEVSVLPEDAALRLLLRHPSRLPVLDPAHPDHEHARAIARMLGRLPLALELAGAYLGKFSGDVSLVDYREGLRSDGGLATLDADAGELTEADLRGVHDPAVAATIGEQWDALGDESARLLLRVASLFAESVAVPIARLSLLASLGDEARPGRLSPLRRALKRLDDACLIERLEDDDLRLHPLIREFAAGRTSAEQVDDFRRQCLERAAAALEHFPTIEALDALRGVHGLQEDLAAILELCPSSAPDLGARVQAVLRLLQREAHNLRVGDEESRPVQFAQQVRNRTLILGISSLQSSAERKLTALGRPYFRLLWTTSRESPALIRTFAGHQDCVRAVAVTPDGHHALSASDDCTLKLWDLATGQARRSFSGHAGPVHAVAILPDGQRALSGSTDGTLKLWDLTTGLVLRTIAAHSSTVTAVVVTSDGRRALSASDAGPLKFWDLTTGQVVRTIAAHSSAVRAVAVTSDCRHALSASSYGTVKLWDLDSGQILRTIDGHDDRVYALTVASDGRQALSASKDGSLKLLDLTTGQVVRTIAAHASAVRAVAVTPDSQQAVSASSFGTVKLWDLASGQVLRVFAGHDDRVTAVVVAPDGRRALSASNDRTLKLWDLSTDRLVPDPAGHTAAVTALAVTPDGRHALSASSDCTLRLWDLTTGQVLSTFRGHASGVQVVVVTPDGRLALSASDVGPLKLWNLTTGQILHTIKAHTSAVRALAVTPDGRQALSVSAYGTVKLWDLASGQVLRTFEQRHGHDERATVAVVAPDGRHVLSGSHDNSLKLRDLATGQPPRILAGHTAKVSAIAVTPDGCHALSGSEDRTLKLWDLTTGQAIRTFVGHERAVRAVAMTADGRYALSGSEDRTIRLWDLAENVCRAMAPLESSVLAIAVAPDSRTIVVGDRVGNIHYFKIHVN